VEAAVSMMLVGTVAFMMMLFYMVNFPDVDIRYYACRTLGDAISIFAAVLIYEAGNKCVHWFVPETENSLAHFGELLFWFTMLQGSTALSAGAIFEDKTLADPPSVSATPSLGVTPTVAQAFGASSPSKALENRWRQRELRLRCISGLLAHITGFSAISAWLSLQADNRFGNPAIRVAVVVPVAAVAMLALFQLGHRVRLFIAYYDEKFDLSEKIWDAAASEAEVDAVSLAISFLSVNAVQFFAFGVLPDREGGVEVELPFEVWRFDAFCMLAGAALAGFVTLTFVLFAERLEQMCPSLLMLVEVVQNYSSMSFAWFVLFAVKAGMHCMFPEKSHEHIVPKVLTALGLSVLAFLAIFVLDKLADAISSGAPTQQAVVKIILSWGLLVGFAWEMCFSSAIATIDERVAGATVVLNLALSVALSALVVPAYLLYLAPMAELSRRKAVFHISKRSSLAITRSIFSRSRSDLPDPDDEDEK